MAFSVITSLDETLSLCEFNEYCFDRSRNLSFYRREVEKSDFEIFPYFPF